MKETSNKSYIAVMCVSVLCLVVIVGSVAYAYFTPKIVGEGSKVNVMAGKINLEISETVINASNLVPILDKTKATKAQKNEFTISRSDDSTLNACYSLYLEVDELGSAFKDENYKYSKYLKYELVYMDGSEEKTLAFDFSTYDTYTALENGNVRLPLLLNEELNNNITSRDYTLRIWLSYDEDNDQTALLTGDASSRTFKAHIYASGSTGKCPTEGGN